MNKLSEVFAVLKPDLSVDTVPVTPTIYQELDANYDQFRGHVLISEYDFSEDWPSWEQHPAGDEVVVLLSGQVELILRRDGANESVSLTQPGTYFVIPRGTWHTAKVPVPAKVLFVTPGEGTEDRNEV